MLRLQRKGAEQVREESRMDAAAEDEAPAEEEEAEHTPEKKQELEEHRLVELLDREDVRALPLRHEGEERGGDRPPDVWLRFHGSGVAELDSSGVHRQVMKSFSQSVSWVLESGSAGMIYAFVTTETTAYDGYFHDLCQDEHGGVRSWASRALG